MNVGIYTRKSVFSDKSDSTEAQAKMCKEYAQNNYEITSITEYEDEGFTGANTNRPDFNRLMKDILNKKINVLICYKIDRISRNVLDFSKTFDILQQNGVEFVSVKEQIDTSTPLGRAMMYICSVFAQMERETTAERVKDSMIELAKSGKWPGGKAPLGYKRERVVIGDKKHTILVEDKEELPLLNFIYDKFLEGYTLSGLETYCKKNNIKTMNGSFLSASQLYTLLKNPHCCAATEDVYDYFKSKGCIMTSDKSKYDGANGVIVYGRTKGGKKKLHTVKTPDTWIVSVGLHKPIIDAEKWLAVQDRFGKNKIDKTRKHEIGLLKGIVKCKCGYAMRVQHKVDRIYNRIYDNYFCQNRNRRGIEYCDLKMVSVAELDGALLNALKSISLDKDLLNNYIKQNNMPTDYRDKNSIKREIRSIEKKIENLTITLRDNLNSSASKYIITEIEKLDRQITGLNYALREFDIMERENKKRTEDIDSVYDKICEFLDKFDSLNYCDKTSFLQKIIRECTWDGRELLLCF